MSFVMSGDGVFLPDTLSGPVRVTLTRLVSKVTLGSVTPLMMKGGLMQRSVIFQSVFLMNASGSVPYDRTPVSELLFNVASAQIDAPSSLSKSIGIPFVSQASVPLDGCTLYSCPNPAESTSLVLVVDVDGQSMYYQAPLPAMDSGKEYIISEMVLAGPGSSEPGEPALRDSVCFTIEVRDWTASGQETTI